MSGFTRRVRHAATVLASLLLLAVFSLPAAAADGDPDGIVYVRVPRSINTVPVTGGEQPGALFDTLPEVHYIKENFNAPGQLVWRRANGEEVIIYDCMEDNPVRPGPPQQGQDVCVPMDPAVSFDGRYLAFSVYHGPYDKTRRLTTVPQGSGEVGKLRSSYGAKPSWAGIYSYDFTTRQVHAWPNANHVWDTAPVWLPDNRIMFSSTRAGIWARFVIGPTEPAQQLWIADVNGDGTNPRNFRNVDPHDQENALHPFVHSAGRVFYSSHQTNRVRIEVTPAGGDHQTRSNLWWLMSTDIRGGDLNAHLHAHRFKWAGNLNQILTLTALHFLGERDNGDLCSDMYYRRNNFGGGKIVCWPALDPDDQTEDRSPLGHEGAYPFKKTQGYYVAIDGDSGDTGGLVDGNYVPRIHARDPAGLPGGQLLFAAGIGANSNCHWTTQRRGFDCDMGIYRSTRIPVRQGSDHGYGTEDTVVVVNSDRWHEFMPKPVMRYSDIYGMPEPTPLVPPDNTNTGISIFGATNAFIGDLKAYPGDITNPDGTPSNPSEEWLGPSDPTWCAQQGCAMQALVRRPGPYRYGNLDRETIKAIRFWKALPNRRQHDNGNKFYGIWGQKLELLGDVPVENDGSFKANLPPDTPFLMAGVDGEGRAVARHQQLMSLRPGERQICAGCHLHDTTDDENALNPFNETLAAQNSAVVPSVPPGQGGVIEWKARIYPMLRNRCGTCHAGGQGDPTPDFTASATEVYRSLVNNLLPVDGLKTMPDRDGDGNHRVALPWMTRYVNVFFARESLLYWKAAGERTDGRSDSTRRDDFDFGPAHPRPASLTDAELTQLANWIEAGAYMDPNADVEVIFRHGFER
ncbi:hypothetical protein [Dokdonella sp.]|uniref:HzsA-related protein n=1 Tax=Dokdonella sp. TaxID=2291710 RepID=UPI0031C8CBA1|nr:hypothetical protein [Dokdonella sp.]